MPVKIGTVWFGLLLLLTTPAEAEERRLEVPVDGLGQVVDSRHTDLFWRQSDWRWYDLGTHWIFHRGDDDRWAEVEFDDSSWTSLDSAGTLLRASTRADVPWDGVGWFRLHLRVFPRINWNTFLTFASEPEIPG